MYFQLFQLFLGLKDRFHILKANFHDRTTAHQLCVCVLGGGQVYVLGQSLMSYHTMLELATWFFLTL